MAILKLVANPTFDAKVLIPVAGAEPAAVSMTFKHRTRTQFAEFLDELSKTPDEPDPTNLRHGVERDADTILTIVTAWDLADEFNRENVIELIENYYGAAEAIYRTYTDALQKAKRGN